MAFTLPPLPYAYDALEPAIDQETMTFHHDKHHQAYVDNLNKAVDADAALQGKSLEELFADISKAPKAVRNNGGGHWNHSLFWELLAPVGSTGEPSAELAAAIESDLGGMDKFKEDFNAAGAGQFGSGWAWLIVQDGKLKVTSTPNQDNPLMDVAEQKGAVVLAADVWEHAYYLKYQNRRPEYLKAFWTIVNWNKANELYAAALKG
ncbi:superoxide dismutase [Brevundimonas sp.]|uniref:superoxide dismutase n=1 Tax=Brevundimonas sp. TaxID=1871086 RepID=UPI003BA9ED71